MELIPLVVLWVHLVCAVLFVGGSFFIWLVVDPVSYLVTNDEAARTKLMGQMARRFGRWTHPLLVILVLTGLYNASWYLPSTGALLTTTGGLVLLVKTVAVAVLIALIYVHGLYYGRRIVRLAREGKLDELRQLRRHSRVVSYANLTLMLIILGLAVLLQMPP
ncbi:MAG TPA: CopD family protein [Thermoplasmata archaeon]|nr:CopD family protein [Thermoplasmata archaeon]